jgi:short-subunit dehydrogenase
MHRITHALVTGASSGLGREMVRQLVLEHGITVLATARRLDLLDELAAELPPDRVHVLAGDLLDAGFREQLWHRAIAFPGGLDLLINNAGAGNYSEFADQDPHAIRLLIELNLMALLDLTQKAVFYMRQRNSGQILQISSVLGFFGIPYSAVYVACKHAVNGLVKSLRYELRGTDVRVWAACPGRTRSEFSGSALGDHAEAERLPRGEPTDRVVRAILRGLTRSPAFLVPTWTAWAGMALASWAPPVFDWFIVRWANRHVRQAIQQASRVRDGK